MVRIKKKRRFILFILIVTLLIAAMSSIFFLVWLNTNSVAYDPENRVPVVVTIPKGTSTRTIGEILESEGLIGEANVFRLKSKLEGFDGKFKAGEYSISPSMTLDEIMELILSGSDSTTRFTVPEGYDIRRTADALENYGLIDREVFLAEIRDGKFDYWFIKNAVEGENRLEGFLYPETYEVFTDTAEHAVIDKMLSQFDTVFTDKHIRRMEELGMTIHEVMTLASIIEREAVISEDRPVISGVFQNRLRIGMPLQSCATVQYILGEQKPVLSVSDTQIQSPYNTYLITGLPPTPICSPGIESINAALWPEETDYLYFLAKGDGSHVFSVTYDEHLRNKAKYIN